MLKNKIIRKKGSSLVLVILVTAVLLILSTALLSLTFADTKGSIYQNDKTQAHYIGRSGVDVGKKILDDKILSGSYSSIDSLTADVNTYATGLGAIPVKDTTGTKTTGNFTLKYEKFSPDEIKITAQSTIPKAFTVKDTVTYIVRVGNSVDFESNPGDWLTGVNLQKGYGPMNNHMKGVKLGGKKIQSPKNGTASTFRSEIIYFLNNDDGSSFRQVTNSIDVTFDALILYAEGKFILNKTNDPVYFTASNDVLTKWNEIDSAFVGKPFASAGFESYERYKDFVRNIETNDVVLSGFHSSYHLSPSSRYGIVYLAANVVEANGGSETTVFTTQPPGYYFFKSGVNLHNINVGVDLIHIDNNDPIIKAVKGYFKYKTDTTGSLWNNK